MTIITAAGVITSDENFRAMNPLTSFPAVLSQADVAPYGMSMLVEVPPPPASPAYTISQGPPAQIDGVWTQTWVQNSVPLAQAQAAQLGALSAACANAIVSGFTSSALGTPYTYPSKVLDQQNLTASVVASMIPNLPEGWTTQFWCADANGNWARVPHNVAQIQQAGIDGKASVEGYQAQGDALSAQVMAATDVATVQSIVWPTT
jgi:hypothetical protein